MKQSDIYTEALTCLRCILLDGSGRAGRGLGLRGGLPARDAYAHEHDRQCREHEQVNGRAPISFCSCPKITSFHAVILPQRQQKRNAIPSTRRTCFVHNFVL